MKKCLLFLIAVLVFSPVFAQKKKLYLTSDDFVNDDPIEVKRMRALLFKDSFVVKMPDGTKKTYSGNEIWGVAKIWGNRNKKVTDTYRYFNKSFLLIREYQDGLAIYSTSRHSPPYSSSTTYYFSKGLDMPIVKFYGINSKRNIMEQFSDNPCFVKKLEEDVKWHQGLSDRNKKTGHQFRFTYLYNECKDGASGQTEVSENF